jgi:hypothetical protein
LECFELFLYGFNFWRREKVFRGLRQLEGEGFL